MAKKIKIPPIPTKSTHFDRGGLLTFKVREGCAYAPEIPGFTGGTWTNARLRNQKGDVALIRIDGGQLVIETIQYGDSIGIKRKEIIRLNICDY